MTGVQFPALDNAIGVFEGFPIPGSVAQRNNNPGNLIASPWSFSQGATGKDESGFAIFPDAATGARALDNLVAIGASNGLTLSQLLNQWSPPNAPGNSAQSTGNYIDYVSGATGLGAQSPVSQASGKSALDTARDWLSGVLGIPPSSGSSAGNIVAATPGGSALAGAGSFLSGLTLTRIVTLIIGVLIIGAGLLSLRPVQTAARTTVRVGRRVAALVA